MSKELGFLYHPVNNHPEKIYTGFSWPCFFFGPFWYLYKGIWGWALICWVTAMLTWGISVVIFPFFANKTHQDSLLKKGYLSKNSNE